MFKTIVAICYSGAKTCTVNALISLETAEFSFEFISSYHIQILNKVLVYEH
jgi:hypothetical protein